MRSNYGDLRFLESETTGVLSYWIENYTAAQAIVWVRRVQASGSDSTIYMYYGNATATTTSNESTTFIRVIDGASPLKGSWSMDEGAGSTTKDNSGRNNTGTRFGVTSWVPGKFGNALSFNNLDTTYVNVPEHDPDFDMTTGITVAAWVNVTALPGTTSIDTIVWKQDAFWLRVDLSNEGTANQFDWFIYSAGTWEPRCASAVVPAVGQWYHVVATFDGSNMRIYVNGALKKTVVRNVIISVNNNTVKIGQHHYGKIDEAAILNRALSADEILDLYNYYGYATPNYPGRILVRKNAPPEPTTSVGNEQLGPPILVSPDNGIATDDSTPTFTWEGGAVNHRLLVDGDDTFASPNVDQTITPPTTFTYTIPDENALADGIYYWKVVAQVAGDNDSGVRWFRVAATSPATPYLISPWNNLVTDQTTLTFGWSNVSGAKQYELWVDYDNDFSSPVVIQENVDGTSKMKTLAGGTYYWKVRAWNWVDVPGDWSETWKFTMENFTLSTVDQIMVIRGSSKSINVSVQLPLGAPTVSLSGAWIGTQPSGVNISFSPESGTVPFSSILTFSASSDATTGPPFEYCITATSANGTIRTSYIDVSITTMSFSIGVFPRTISLMRSDAATSSVSVYFLDGVPENVTLSWEWIGSIPDGVDASFDQTVGVPDFSSVLSFTTGGAAATGRFTFQVTGTSEGGATITESVTVNVSTTVTITMATDETIYEKMQSIRISGTAKNPKNVPVGSGTATISIVSGSWSQPVTATITDGAYEASYFITLANPEGTWTISVSAVDSYGNATSEPVSVDVTVIYPIILNYVVTFSSPTSSQPCSRGLPVTVTVQVTENDTKISGANVVLITFRGDNVPLAGGLSGVYSVAYTLPLDTPTGNLDMTVIAEKTVDGVLKTGMKSITVRINPAELSLELISPPPTKREFEAGDIVEVRVQARYSDDSPIGEAIIAVNKPGGENLPLIAMGGGIYGATYTIRDEDVGTWNIQISAFDAYGNSSSVAAASTVIVQPGIVRYIIRYWPVVLAAILGLGVASAFVAQGSLRTRRLGIIKREKREIERLTKEAAFEYFKKGSIPRETYDNLTKEYATKLTNLDKEERILIDKMKKKKLSEKKHPMKKGR
jgi:hypothetical protein